MIVKGNVRNLHLFFCNTYLAVAGEGFCPAGIVSGRIGFLNRALHNNLQIRSTCCKTRYGSVGADTDNVAVVIRIGRLTEAYIADACRIYKLFAFSCLQAEAADIQLRRADIGTCLGRGHGILHILSVNGGVGCFNNRLGGLHPCHGIRQGGLLFGIVNHGIFLLGIYFRFFLNFVGNIYLLVNNFFPDIHLLRCGADFVVLVLFVRERIHGNTVLAGCDAGFVNNAVHVIVRPGFRLFIGCFHRYGERYIGNQLVCLAVDEFDLQVLFNGCGIHGYRYILGIFIFVVILLLVLLNGVGCINSCLFRIRHSHQSVLSHDMNTVHAAADRCHRLGSGLVFLCQIVHINSACHKCQHKHQYAGSGNYAVNGAHMHQGIPYLLEEIEVGHGAPWQRLIVIIIFLVLFVRFLFVFIPVVLAGFVQIHIGVVRFVFFAGLIFGYCGIGIIKLNAVLTFAVIGFFVFDTVLIPFVVSFLIAALFAVGFFRIEVCIKIFHVEVIICILFFMSKQLSHVSHTFPSIDTD